MLGFHVEMFENELELLLSDLPTDRRSVDYKALCAQAAKDHHGALFEQRAKAEVRLNELLKALPKVAAWTDRISQPMIERWTFQVAHESLRAFNQLVDRTPVLFLLENVSTKSNIASWWGWARFWPGDKMDEALALLETLSCLQPIPPKPIQFEELEAFAIEKVQRVRTALLLLGTGAKTEAVYQQCKPMSKSDCLHIRLILIASENSGT